MNKKLWVKYAAFSVLSIILTVIDQITKGYMVKLAGGVEGRSFPVIKGILSFTYIKNEGASMGILKGQGVFLIVVTVMLLLGGIIYLKHRKPDNVLFLTAVSLVASGAVGNLIDRITLGYVRDFIEPMFIKFYIFNVADCAICIGAMLLVVYGFLNFED